MIHIMFEALYRVPVSVAARRSSRQHDPAWKGGY